MNYYFGKSNIPAINLIVGSRNMIEVPKNIIFKKKIRLTARVVSRNTDNFSIYFFLNEAEF